MTVAKFLTSLAEVLRTETLSVKRSEGLARACTDYAMIAMNLEMLERDPNVMERWDKFSGFRKPKPRAKPAPPTA